MRWRKSGVNTSGIGEAAEQSAEQWLSRQGLRLVEKNYRCKAGEIDLVMLDHNSLVFVEVRYRKQNSFGGSLESVDWRKQKKLSTAARHFLVSRKQYCNLPCRFDVMAASPVENCPQEITWQWIKDAFGV